MRKFLLGALAGAVLAVMGGVIFFFASIRFVETPPSMPDKALLVISPEGDIPEIAPLDVPFGPMAERSVLTVLNYWELFRAAAHDARVKAVLLRPRRYGAGWAKADELRQGIDLVRKSGKPVYALLEGAGTREYYLASAATKIFMTPEDLLDVKGMRIEARYFRNTLSKLGVEVEVEHIGKYKDAADTFSRDSMTPETKQVLNSVLDATWDRWMRTVSAARKLSGGELAKAVDNGPFLAPGAKDARLIDDLLYADQVEEKLTAEAKAGELEKVGHAEYLKVVQGERGGGSRRPKIAILMAQGDIVRGAAAGLLGDDQSISPAPVAREARRIAEDPSIRGVLLRIDSPGGDAIASDEILREIRSLSKKKPLVISMSDVAASGGYYMAMTGDPIVAYPGTYTGSIGVVYGKVNLKGLYEKLGIKTEILKRGKFADIDSESQPLTAEGRQKLRTSLQAIYDGFLKRVSEGRKMDVQAVDELAQGRVWLGSQAKAEKLVDELGGFDVALSLLRARAHIADDSAVTIEVYPRPRSFFEALLGRRPSDWDPAANELRAQIHALGIDSWLQGGLLRVMPYRLDIR